MSNKAFSLEKGDFDFTIYGMLSEKNVTTLRKIAKHHKLRGYSKMKKADLQNCLESMICEKERLPETFYLLDKKKWILFEELITEDYIKIDDEFDEIALNFENLGIAFIFLDKKFKYIAIPHEIKKIFYEICDSKFLEKREKISLYDDYTNSAMALYGLVKTNELGEIFETLSKKSQSYDEIIDAIKGFSKNGAQYCIFQDYIVSNAFEDNDFEDVQKFADIIYSNPRYTPTDKEFLKYSSYEYYEITSQIKALKKYLISKTKTEDFVADIIVDEIHHLSAVQGNAQEFVDVFNKYKIITKEEQVYDLMDLVHEVSMNTRLVGNHGHTQLEIMEIRGEVPEKKISYKKNRAISQKAGRNEPCICGSGKKYKKCCGL